MPPNRFDHFVVDESPGHGYGEDDEEPEAVAPVEALGNAGDLAVLVVVGNGAGRKGTRLKYLRSIMLCRKKYK